jgi:predicted thioredoxin/glutaredoxin
MSKVIDISAKLTNERPKIKISEDKIYEIDDRKNTILKMYQMFRDGDVNDIEMMDEVIKMLLGEKAAKEIDEMNLSIKNYQTIVIAIMASIQEITFEEAEELFRKASGL